nr:peptidoglycan glycosyltransferase [Eubacterium sp.]
MKKTLFLFLIFVFILFVALLVKIYLINRDHGDEYKKKVLSQQSYTNTVLNYQRGSIKDRNNTILAQSVRKFNMIIEPRTFLNEPEMKEETLAKIAQYFAFDVNEIEKIISEHPQSMYQHVDGLKKLTGDQIKGFQEEMEKNELVGGVWFEETYTRNYPLETIACNIVGFTSSDNQGTYGIEGTYNDELNGKVGREYGYFDANMEFQRTVKKATNGNSVVLTIDANVQRVIENQIRKYNKNVGAENIAVMVMDPGSGEVLAMASQNTYDLNDPQDLTHMYGEEEIAAMDQTTKSEKLLSMWSNFCIASAYEPGSTYKPFTVAAALDEGLIKPTDYFGCGGVLDVSGVQIHCSNRSGHGSLSLEQSMMESCNSALMQIGAKLERTRFSKYNKIFGFGQKTGIDLPGETAGLIHTEEELNPVELATSSFGQTQTVTMVQMLSGFCSLINGGNYYQPHIVKEIQNDNGAVVESVEPIVVKKTVSSSTSNIIRQQMKATVEEGTAAPAQVKGYSIGGKTGTAEKRPVTDRNYLVSFIGCVPAENPQAAIYVIIDQPHVEDQAHSTYATEFASKIMKKILPFLGLYAEETEEEVAQAETEVVESSSERASVTEE